MPNDYDVLIVGGGLAGLTAGMFAARYGLHTGIIEQMMGGAQIINLEKIENFPGFPEGIAGAELGPAAQEQAMDAGANFLMGEVDTVTRDGNYKVGNTDSGSYRAKSLIIAAGSVLRQLKIGEDQFDGKGVSHCATCDGPFYMGQTVGVVGGGDSAADEALTLTEYADRVLLFHRSEQFKAQKILQERLVANPKIDIYWNTEVQGVLGEDTVSGVRAHNVVTNLDTVVDLSGLFIYVGLEPNSDWLGSVVKRDRAGHIEVDVSMETSVSGIFAAGDIRQNSVSQLISSAGDGATAAISAFKYIRGMNW